MTLAVLGLFLPSPGLWESSQPWAVTLGTAGAGPGQEPHVCRSADGHSGSKAQAEPSALSRPVPRSGPRQVRELGPRVRGDGYSGWAEGTSARKRCRPASGSEVRAALCCGAGSGRNAGPGLRVPCTPCGASAPCSGLLHADEVWFQGDTFRHPGIVPFRNDELVGARGRLQTPREAPSSPPLAGCLCSSWCSPCPCDFPEGSFARRIHQGRCLGPTVPALCSAGRDKCPPERGLVSGRLGFASGRPLVQPAALWALGLGSVPGTWP